VIGNAACEPHVQDLARMLVKMGADIQGIGSNLITVNGADGLHGCEHDVAQTTSRSAASWRSRASPAESCASRTPVPGDLRMIRLVFERVGLRSDWTATT